MLLEIRSEVFRAGPIEFHKGLNVILGDANATNSIGKSTLLMVIDFAYGGNDFLRHNTDIVNELGNHDYYFTFDFSGIERRFRRGTKESGVVYVYEDGNDITAAWSLDEYTEWLKQAYGLSAIEISFRSLLGPYIRVWGKDNLNVRKPLHSVQVQNSRACVDNLIKTFGRFGDIYDLEASLRERDAERRALKQAFKREIVPKIGKRVHRENVEKIASIEKELEDIKNNLAKYATSIAEIVNREVIELKSQRDVLLSTKFELEGRRERTRRNLSSNRHIKSSYFDGLVDFFPYINKDRLAQVEEFHSELAQILRGEFRAAEKDLNGQIGRVSAELSHIDAQMAAKLRSIDQPSLIIDRTIDLSLALGAIKRENKYHEDAQKLAEVVQSLKEELVDLRGRALRAIQELLNESIKNVVSVAFGEDRKSPEIRLTENSYSYEVFEDTGTGTAYAGLIVFDLAMFGSTVLPVIAHDSVLFKNVENNSVAKLFDVYQAFDKQSFVSIDEVDKYGAKTAAMLQRQKVIQLSNTEVLYTKDWRK